MSTINALPPPPFHQTLTEHLQHLRNNEFVLATVKPSSTSPTSYEPRARYCIYRGMWASMPVNSKNDAPLNPSVYTSCMPTFTSDVRMEKIPEIFATSEGKADRSELTQGSGGGGPVEAVFWVEEFGTEWRVRGRAYVVAPDIEDKESSGVRTVKSEVGKMMQVREEERGREGEWSWQRELTAHFGNCSPGMRGTFRNPPPGEAVNAISDEHRLGQKVTDLNDSIARANFRVVIIKPDEVEQINIKDPNDSYRMRYTLRGDTWEEQKLWP